ncbi:unnamed protein product [Clonostachys rosea f. rosea IK726]|uniref:Uncharacterized protein n=2 Tax=Bionectria ochroleuca TaxID=29856 RepID=A0A0B7KDS2_BIOOC|nr:unnamed protein product [Clonostachys rosea f. rosea IK726]
MFPTIPAPEERRMKKSRPSPRRLWRFTEEPTFERTAVSHCARQDIYALFSQSLDCLGRCFGGRSRACRDNEILGSLAGHPRKDGASDTSEASCDEIGGILWESP